MKAINPDKRNMANSKRLYNASSGPKYNLISQWIGKNKRILDVGCGTGKFSKKLSCNNNHVTGVEFSEENYLIAKDKINVYYGDFTKIDINEKFDIVLLADVLEHMYYPDNALKKAIELADEVILCIPNFDFWVIKVLEFLKIKKIKLGFFDENHVFYFNKKIIEKLINDNGLKIIDFSSPSPGRFPGFYTHISNIKPEVTGIQFIYRCKKTIPF